MLNDAVGTTWQRFARKVTGLWRDPVEADFAMIAAASLEAEKEGLQAARKEAQLAVWEDEGGTASGPIPSPRRSALTHRRATYSP